MIPLQFDYARPDTLDDAIALLAEKGEDASVLAGGHSLIPVMKVRLGAPEFLIDIGRLPELSYIRVEGDEVAIGAGTKHRDVVGSPELAAEVPLLPAVARTVGDPQIRARGTLGGTLAHGDPAADLPAAVLALDGTIVLQGPRGRRTVPIGEFYTGVFTTVREPDELIVEIRIPRCGDRGWAYEKFTRRSNDWAIVAVAVSGDRIGLVNMGSTSLRATATEQALKDGKPIAEAAALAAEGTEPPSDTHGTPAYRTHLVQVLVRRALETARGH
ncbi:Carbon monoxide dehydrogenase medium chain [Pseudonocardia sp. Ae168_Ps1]|uniref:FAD binding domain-containing protein n=1 Tax=unclassified Pseudonocardia TaxID=2619320 RepID=UPI00094B58C0|nr:MULTISPECIES: xanthine dehydrogenase family protein subunit M [unclassified Pseudonocardia]OLL74528.1 Carbon monoxide dehydrogenase medium chain [Pseudonocardia sp. Ae150A_Ps1]OLL80508.1 Carbon monoxide dehydrogenase medium chain [Pseudonocardia sp. Ae168_Ps1]OLL85364.1 Carbon monoxide dehydrogenase medium chain [Pseudonocardia sp. Ae263_Ps1]OLL94609.1 Carbon monoxide dehydrogenase medium chain [Pseudonocardia sp. Ae356_Ps1]